MPYAPAPAGRLARMQEGTTRSSSLALPRAHGTCCMQFVPFWAEEAWFHSPTLFFLFSITDWIYHETEAAVSAAGPSRSFLQNSPRKFHSIPFPPELHLPLGIILLQTWLTTRGDALCVRRVPPPLPSAPPKGHKPKTGVCSPLAPSTAQPPASTSLAPRAGSCHRQITFGIAARARAPLQPCGPLAEPKGEENEEWERRCRLSSWNPRHASQQASVPPRTRPYCSTFRETREKIALNNLPFRPAGTELHSALNSSCFAFWACGDKSFAWGIQWGRKKGRK